MCWPMNPFGIVCSRRRSIAFLPHHHRASQAIFFQNIPIYFEINPLAEEAMNVLNVQHGGKASQMKKDLFGKTIP